MEQSESTHLDFKRAQYPFAGASDDVKSDLLKDILAFANASRASDGFLLIGVEEVKGGRGIVRGVSQHFDDATLQQFVNAKTQRAIRFSVETVAVDGRSIDVIRVPVQRRPFHLRKDYGKLKANAVYFRRGTSTSEANPDEIAAMGEEWARLDAVHPDLFLHFADSLYSPSLNLGATNYSAVGATLELQNMLPLDPHLIEPKVFPNKFLGDPIEGLSQKGASAALQTQLEEQSRLIGMMRYTRFAITNRGPGSVLNVAARITIPRGQGLFAATADQVSRFHQPTLNEMLGLSRKEANFHLLPEGNDWLVTLTAERILPGHMFVASEDLHFGATQTGRWQLRAIIYADNLNPKDCQLSLHSRICGSHLRIM